VDRHEQDDVVEYRQKVFLPVWAEMLSRTHVYEDGIKNRIPHRHVVIWNHDESTYYAKDRRKIHWVHKSETMVPYAKGEGPSMMIADYASPDHGLLQSPVTQHRGLCGMAPSHRRAATKGGMECKQRKPDSLSKGTTKQQQTTSEPSKLLPQVPPSLVAMPLSPTKM
jgi:hypothetical protein